MRTLLVSLLVLSITFFGCSEKPPGDVQIKIDAENLEVLEIFKDFEQENLQVLMGLSEQDSINVNYETKGKNVLFTLINTGKNNVYVGKEPEDLEDNTPFKLQGTKYKNLTMFSIALHSEKLIKPGEKYEISVEFEEFGNYLVGFLYHIDNNGENIMNIRWKYSKIIDLQTGDQV